MKKNIKDCISLVEVLRHRAEYQSDKTAYIHLEDGEVKQQITYSELDHRARIIASVLREHIPKGERALLLYNSSIEYIEAFFGCLYAGIVAVPLYPPDPKRPHRSLLRIKVVLENAQTNFALTTSEIAKSLTTSGNLVNMETLKVLTTDNLIAQNVSDFKFENIPSSTLVYLLYTSGSTGLPKGVVVNYENILHNLESIGIMCEHNEESKHVSWLPMYHDFGLIVATLEPLYSGFTSIFMSPLTFLKNPFHWLNAISKYKATTAGGPNFAYELCMRKISDEDKEKLDLSSWKTAINGAEPVKEITLEAFSKTFASCGFRSTAFNPSYGMTQATASITFTSNNEPPLYLHLNRLALENNKVECFQNAEDKKHLITFVGCGKSLPGQEIKIVNPSTLTVCSENEVGEIWIKGPSVGQGYWNNLEETNRLFRAYLQDNEEGPFLRTEDLGFIKYGQLFITGRLKDIIIIHGLNHYPQDIEETVEKSHHSLRPGCSAAFSIEHNNAEELVIIAEVERRYRKEDISITPDSNATRQEDPEINAFSPDLNNPINVKEVTGNIREAVSQYHDLKIYSIVLIKAGSIPKTSSGKIQRHACKIAYLANTLEIIAKG
jgi:acyl-CoA synthetase (AMP-forming)/AMP-acid ligase II